MTSSGNDQNLGSAPTLEAWLKKNGLANVAKDVEDFGFESVGEVVQLDMSDINDLAKEKGWKVPLIL